MICTLYSVHQFVHLEMVSNKVDKTDKNTSMENHLFFFSFPATITFCLVSALLRCHQYRIVVMNPSKSQWCNVKLYDFTRFRKAQVTPLLIISIVQFCRCLVLGTNKKIMNNRFAIPTQR